MTTEKNRLDGYVIAIIGALGGIIVAIVGLFAAKATNIVNVEFGAATPAPTATQTVTVTALAPPVTGAASSTDGAGAAASAQPGVYRSGPLSFNSDSTPTDLDAIPSDLQWGRGGSLIPGDGHDLTVSGNNLQIYVYSSAGWDFLPSAPSLSQCESDTNYEHEDRSFAQFISGTFMCIHTDGGRFAIVKITKSTPESVTWDVTVYKSSSDE